jgi:TfoX/Sxy family transcriptional regulator of competence genes
MAYNEALAANVRKALAHRRSVSEKPMFGGLSFLVRGNMCCGVVGNELMVRVGPAKYEAALSTCHAREMDFTGRSLRGYVYVARDGLRSARTVRAWVDKGVVFARSLPPK